eukprot:TRINITY_DN8154_c0_g3_i1.p1 TRINITY_DN8154_c0_g3~~TRINITY_DN8154_c0_g3_i1.p1  ORF type:complete len:366 (+),score=101.25 TRINITY_DN8154_c0_g3_i1:80-1177(+)
MQNGKYKRKRVLTEDEYEQKLKGIITRDYFPGLLELRKEEKLLTEGERALGDIEKRILGGEPNTGLEEETEEPVADIPKETLGEFITSAVSEEDVSFDMLMQNDKEEHKRKWAWCYKGDINTSALINGPTQGLKLLADGSHASATSATYTIEANPSGTTGGLLITTAKSGASGKVSTSMGPPKAINKAGTRFEEHTTSKKKKLKKRPPMEMRIGEKRDLVATPVIEPGDSPFVTWGELDATPLVLDTDKDEAAAVTSGLTLPEVREREIQGNKLMAQAKRKKASRSQNTPLKDKLLASVGLTPRPTTSSSVLAALTPSRTDIFSKGNAYKATPRRPSTARATPKSTPRSTPIRKKSSITDDLLEI